MCRGCKVAEGCKMLPNPISFTLPSVASAALQSGLTVPLGQYGECKREHSQFNAMTKQLAVIREGGPLNVWCEHVKKRTSCKQYTMQPHINACHPSVHLQDHRQTRHAASVCCSSSCFCDMRCFCFLPSCMLCRPLSKAFSALEEMKDSHFYFGHGGYVAQQKIRAC